MSLRGIYSDAYFFLTRACFCRNEAVICVVFQFTGKERGGSWLRQKIAHVQNQTPEKVTVVFYYR